MLLNSPDNENMLVAAMRTGDQAAFTTLYRHYSPQLYLNIRNIVCDEDWAGELVQELFTRIWQKRENAALEQNFRGYLYRTAQNLVIDFFREINRDRKMQERFASLATKHYLSIEEAIENAELKLILQKAINQLSPQQKKAFELVRMQGNSYKQAAEIMGISPHTIKEYLVNSQKLIRDFISRQTGSQAETISLLIILSIIF